MLDEQPVEKRLVAVLQRGEADVLLEFVTLAAEMLELEGDLLLDRHGSPGQKAPKSERRPFVVGEGGVLVDGSTVEQLTTARRHRLNRQVTSAEPTRAQHSYAPFVRLRSHNPILPCAVRAERHIHASCQRKRARR